MVNMNNKIAASCPKFESIQLTNGFGINLINSSRPGGPRCDQCLHWHNGNCEFFLAKGNH